MNARSLRSEVKRLAALVGADEEPVHLVTLTVVDTSAGQMDLPDDTGPVLTYRIQGHPASFFFPFSAMNSDQAEELALAIVQHKYQGRPVDEELHKRVKELLGVGLGIRATARHAKCSTTTVLRIKETLS